MAESYGLLRPRNTNGVLPVEQEFRRSQQRKNRQGMTHYDTPEEGETIPSLLGQLKDWAVENPVDAGFMAASTAPVVGDAIGLGKDIYDMSPMGDTEFNLTNSLLAGAGALPFVPSGMGSIKKVTDRATEAINKRYMSDADQAAIDKAQAEMFGYNTRDQYLSEARETGNKVEVPWRASGRKLSLDEIDKLESNLDVTELGSHYQRRNIFTPEDIPIGSYMTPAIGDGSAAGVIHHTQAGPTDTVLQAGAQFGQRGDNPIWASLEDNLSNLTKAAGRHPDVDKYTVTMPMGPDSMNYNLMMNDLLMEQLPTSKILKKDIKEFNTAAKAAIPEEYAKTFPGIDDPNLKDWMEKIPGKWRSAIEKTMDKKKWIVDKGFPDVGANRAAVTRDSQRWLPQLLDPMAGYNISKMEHGATPVPSGKGLFGHNTYEATLPGKEYMGGPEVLLPRSSWFPTHHNKVTQRGLTGSPMQGSWRQSYMEEEMTNKLQDNLMKQTEEVLKRR